MRNLPWRADRDPYRVWVSEIMLQQTRVEAVKPYYRRFMEAFPTVDALAGADDEELMKRWAGLGYYRRARYLKKCAQAVVSEHGGRFPATAAELRKLPGIGRYTAGAIASIAFEEDAPAVDGNVLRLLSRFYAAPVEVNGAETALKSCFPPDQCGDFTQSLMELGATVCLPNGEPLCKACPLASDCRARRLGKTGEFPLPPAKAKRKIEILTVLVLRCHGKIALRKRPEKGVLAGMWELPNLPGEHPEWGTSFGQVRSTFRSRHVFTHLEWEMLAQEVECETESPDFQWSIPGAHPLPGAFAKLLAPRKKN